MNLAYNIRGSTALAVAVVGTFRLNICLIFRIASQQAILLLISCFPVCALSEAAVGSDEMRDTKVAFAGDIANYYPHHFLGKDGKPTGFDVELFRRIGHKEGWITEFQFHEWSRTLDLLEAGKVDVVPMFVTKERKAKYLFSDPILRRSYLVFGRKGSAYINSLDALASRRVAVQYASIAWEELQSRLSSVMIIPVNREAAAIISVAQGNADFAMVPAYIGYDTINKNGFKDIVAVSLPLLECSYAFAISLSRPELQQELNNQLRQLQISGEQDELYMKWLANLVPPSESYRSGLLAGGWIALPLLVSLLVSLTLVYVWWRRAHRSRLLEYQRAESEATMRRLAQEQVHFLAYRDPTTKLPNRNALRDQLDETVTLALRRHGRCAVVCFELMSLDLIEAVGGQDLSDEVICSVAQRLIAQWGLSKVAYLGRGEFAVVLEDGDGASFERPLSDLMNLIQEPLDLRELALTLDCRAGMALFPEHGSSARELLRAAEVACAATRHGYSSTRVYDPGMEPDPRNLTLLGDLRQALLEDTLGYAVQPKLCLSTRRFVGAEMLVRWHHPRYGALAPGVFVPLAEQTGIIGAMTLYLIRHAIRHCREWQQLGLDMSLSVNVSVNDLADSELVETIIQDTEGLGHMLILEVTETDMMRDADEVLRSIDRLRGRRIRISLDDFGTGHASLTYLQRMAPNEIKIDRSFVSGLLHSASDQLIVRTSIQLAHDLNATVTAEGIEDDNTLEWLAAAGCDMVQGFAVAKPMSIADFLKACSVSSKNVFNSF